MDHITRSRIDAMSAGPLVLNLELSYTLSPSFIVLKVSVLALISTLYILIQLYIPFYVIRSVYDSCGFSVWTMLRSPGRNRKCQQPEDATAPTYAFALAEFRISDAITCIIGYAITVGRLYYEP